MPSGIYGTMGEKGTSFSTLSKVSSTSFKVNSLLGKPLGLGKMHPFLSLDGRRGNGDFCLLGGTFALRDPLFPNSMIQNQGHTKTITICQLVLISRQRKEKRPLSSRSLVRQETVVFDLAQRDSSWKLYKLALMGPPAPKARPPAAFARNFLFSISRKKFRGNFSFFKV